VWLDNRLVFRIEEDCLPQPLVPATAFGDAWIQVDRTENPRFFVNLLDATRARLLERARTSPGEFFAPLALRPGLNILDVGCGTGDFVRLLAPNKISPDSGARIEVLFKFQRKFLSR
jgi:SAM-dependent methyltransferase